MDPDVSPDGTRIVFSALKGGLSDLFIYTLADKTIHPLTSDAFADLQPAWSPDGRWLAYQSNESGRYEIYVRPFPDVNAPLRWQVSNEGGTRPLWSRDGKELYYAAAQGQSPRLAPRSGVILAVPVLQGAPIGFGTPKVVVDGPYLAPQAGRHYDVSRAGRFLMIKDARTPNEIGAEPEIIVVQNWVEELKRIAPPP